MASKAWDQRENESAPAYEAFMDYLTQEPAKRSVRQVVQNLHKSLTLIGGWSSKHDWPDRVRSFDAENDRKAIAAEQKRALDRIGSMRRRHRRMGRKALEIALEAMLELRDEMTMADVYRLMRGGLLLERSGFENAVTNTAATSGDLTDPLKQGTPQSLQPQGPTMLRKLEIEIIGAGGQLVPASEIAATMASFYDKPGGG